MLKAGFIGAGGRSQSAHYPSVARLDNVEMVAACELDEERWLPVAQSEGSFVDAQGFGPVAFLHQKVSVDEVAFRSEEVETFATFQGEE